ncbi:MAG: hypothetical protein ACI9XO_000527 [Paraglaciecola sp.]|jgi:hypothetical protein
MNSRHFLKYGCIHIVLPLFLGVAIYFIWGNSSSKLLEMLQRLLRNDLFFGLKEWLQAMISIPNFVIYQLPDALWAYTFCTTLLWIWQRQNTAFVTIIAFSLCTIYELMQRWQLTAGTFDILDVLAMLIACLCALLFTKKSIAL